VGTNRTSCIDRVGDKITVPIPSIGDLIPLAVIITVLEQSREKLVNMCRSQVIWSVAPVSIIQSLFLVITERFRAELDIPDLVTNPTAVER
jgi:hypothetical protein